MALSATFTANFSSFYDAVAKADAQLKDFGAGADKVGGRLNTLANQFSGQKIVQEATLMAKAVEEIGGVTKLTDKELARLGSTAQEAVAKMKALGMEVPKNLQEIADKTKGAEKATTDWMGGLTKLAASMGIAFSVDALKNFIGSVFDAAGAIKDLSDQWGVSTQFVQQWSAAAKLSGVEAEQVGKSIQFLTEKLGESSPEYAALLKNIGLSNEALRKMPTEDAYKEVIKAIAGIKDETLQLDIAMGILGPSAKKIIGGIRDGMYDAADAQKFMADETIKRLADAGDAWEKFKNKIVIVTGEALGEVMKDTEIMTKSWGNFFLTMGAAVGGAGGAKAMAAIEGALGMVDKTMKATVTTTETFTAAGAQMTSGLKTTAQVLEEGRKKTEALKTAEQARTTAQAAAKKAQEDYTKGLATQNQKLLDLVNTFEGRDLIAKANLYLEALKDSIPVQMMTAKQQDDINKVMVDAIKVYDAAGEEAPQALYDMWAATLKADEATVQYGEDLSKLKSPAISFDLPNTGPGLKISVPPPTALEEWSAQVAILADEFQKLGQTAGGSLGEIYSGIGQVIVLMDAANKSTQQIGKNGKALGGSFGAISTMFNENASSSQKWGAAIQTGTAVAAGAMDVWAKSANQGSKAANVLGGTMAGAKAGAAFGPWGIAIGAAAGALTGFIRNMTSGRKAVEDFAKAQGGFDALHTQLGALGAAGEQMWIKLTQQTGKGDLEGAKKQIEAITNALQSEPLRTAFVDSAGGFEALQHAAEKAGVSVDALFAAKTADEVTKSIKTIEDALKFQEDAYQLAIDTAEKYGFTIEELGPAMARQELDKQAQQLFKDWEVLNSAGIDTIAITDKMSKSVSEYVQHAMKMGIEIPEAMRPMLESMAKSGDLLDENGKAITDLDESGLSFAMTMSDGFKALIDQVSKLTDAISRSLGLAIKNVPDLVIKGKVVYEESDVPAPRGGGQELPAYAEGTDGFRNFGKGTPVMLHGWEAVVPRDDAGSFATVAGAPVMAAAAAAPVTSIVINAQGAFFDTPGDLQRLADRVNDALTAKHGLRNQMRAG